MVKYLARGYADQPPELMKAPRRACEVAQQPPCSADPAWLHRFRSDLKSF